MQTRFRLIAGLLVILAGCGSEARAHAGHVIVRLEPDTVAVGEDTTLVVTLDDEALAAPSVPKIAGLDMQSIGQQTNMTMVNGVTQHSVSYLYRVHASQPGDFTLDGIHAGTVPAPPLTLHVSASPQPRANAAPHSASSASRGASSEPASDLAFMRLQVDTQRSYAGQSVPFTVQAYFRGGTGVTVKGRPELSSDAFTVSGLDDSPTQKQITLAGVPYLAVTWRGALTAVKAGDHPLDMSLPVSLQYRELRPTQAQPRRSLRDLFGDNSPFGAMAHDPFFDSMLDQPMFDGFLDPGQIVTRDIRLHGRAGSAHVSPLPEAGKPSDFSGAVGQFELQASLPQTALMRGEPVELHFSISGSGNFGQFTMPGLADSDNWKTYAPHDSFKGSDKLGFRGTTQYVQPVAAKRDGDLELPGLRFSYFDPIAKHYVTRTTPAIAVHVAAAPALASEPEPSAAPDLSPAARLSADSSVQSLVNGGVPRWLMPLGAAALLVGLLFAAAASWLRSPRHARLRERRQAARQIARERRAMRRAAREGDRIAYLRAGRQAIQRRLATAWHVTPESISAHELDLRWPEAPDTIRRLFELADQADYAGGRLQPTPELADLTAWSRRLDSQIAHMEVPS
jgi:hypothetical protein